MSTTSFHAGARIPQGARAAVGVAIGAAAAGIAALTVAETWAAAFLVAAVCFTFAAIESQVFVLMLLFLLPLDFVPRSEFVFTDLGLAAHSFVVVGFFAGCIVRGELDWRKTLRSPITRASILFLAAVGVSVVFGAEGMTHEGLRGIYYIASFIGFYLIMVFWLSNKERLRKAAFVLLASTVVAAAFGIFQAAVGGYTSLWTTLYPAAAELQPWESRPPSFFGHENTFAGYLVLMLPFALACYVLSPVRKWKRLATWTLALGCPALLLTQSRGGLIAFVCVLVFAVFYFVRSRRRQALLILGTGALAVGVYLVIKLLSPARADVGSDMSVWSRLLLWGVAWQLFLSSPVHGIGFGAFPNTYGLYLPSSLGIGTGLEAHNIYFELLGETGVLGLAAVLYLFGRAAYQSLVIPKSADWFDRAIVFGAAGAILANFVHSMFEQDVLWAAQGGTLFWTWLAMLVASGNLRSAVPCVPSVGITSPAVSQGY